MTVSLEINEVVQTDVLIVGGGTAGCLAALAAADEGCRVVILERDHALGGVGTRAGCHLYWYGSTGGFQHQIDKECQNRSRLFEIKSRGFHPDAKRTVLGEWVLERGIQVFFDTIVFEVIKEGNRVAGVLAASSDKIIEIQAKITIDSSGDGDLAAFAGVRHTLGRNQDGIMQGYSLLPRVVDLPDKIGFNNFDAGWADTLNTKDLSRAYQEGRHRLKNSLKEDQRFLSISPQLGVREGRHIVGKYQLTLDDFIQDKTFDDTIIRAHAHYDNHANDFGNETDFGQIWTVVLGLFKHGVSGNVPYRCIVPEEVRGLLVACRALSVDRDGSMAVRMQRDMQKLGEAAGMAAALCVRQNILPDELDVTVLQQHLVRRKVISAEDLSRDSIPDLQFRTGSLQGVVLTLKEAGQRIPAVLEYLSAEEEESKALWWLWKCGEAAVEPLMAVMLQDASPRRRSAASFVLGLLNKREAIPVLLDTMISRDEEVVEKFKPYPRWIAALSLLRLLRAEEALPEVLNALMQPHPPKYQTFMLQYLEEMLPLLSGEKGELVRTSLNLWLDNPDLGDNYLMSGGRNISLKWNLELKAALLLGRLGDQRSLQLCRSYLSEERQVVRQAAEMTLNSLMELQQEVVL